MEQAPSPRGFDLRELPRRTVLIAAGVLLLVVVLGAIALSGGFSKYSLKGTLTVYEAVGSGACTGTGGFDDIHLGAPVTVRDGSGKILALGSLDAGRVAGGRVLQVPVCDDRARFGLLFG